MKLLHTADWHIGKKLNGFSLLDEQVHAFNQLKEVAIKEKVDGIIIAGDLYDRSIPPVEAVRAFDRMLMELNLEEEIPLYAISGNHDGANRLNFANSWMEKENLYLRTNLEEAIKPIELDGVQLYLLPFFDPINAREYYQIPEDEIDSMRTINQAVNRVVEDMKQTFNPEKKQILVSHFHVVGKENEDYELTSETSSTVGGLNAVDASLFADFDHVALGHLHLKEASPTDKIRYSGSLVKFNTKEAHDEKGFYILNIDENGIDYEFSKIHAKKDLIVLKDTFENLVDSDFRKNYPAKGKAFYSIKLTKRPEGISNPRMKLQEIYGDIVDFEIVREIKDQNISQLAEKTKNIENINPMNLMQDFYEYIRDEKLNEEQVILVEDTLEEVRRREE